MLLLGKKVSEIAHGGMASSLSKEWTFIGSHAEHFIIMQSHTHMPQCGSYFMGTSMTYCTLTNAIVPTWPKT